MFVYVCRWFRSVVELRPLSEMCRVDECSERSHCVHGSLHGSVDLIWAGGSALDIHCHCWNIPLPLTGGNGQNFLSLIFYTLLLLLRSIFLYSEDRSYLPILILFIYIFIFLVLLLLFFIICQCVLLCERVHQQLLQKY